MYSSASQVFSPQVYHLAYSYGSSDTFIRHTWLCGTCTLRAATALMNRIHILHGMDVWPFYLLLDLLDLFE